MPLPEVRAHVWYQRQQRISRRAVDLASKTWGLLNPQDLTSSWNGGLGSYLGRVVSAAQLTAAAGSTAYTSAVVSDAGVTPNPLGRVNPAAFAGQTADGRSLGSLLYLPIIDVKAAIALGATTEGAMLRGLVQLLTYVDTEVADASRGSAQVAGTADTTVIGYVRYLTGAGCDRCIILAGRFYKHNEGFERHPQCDCQHRPVTAAEWAEHKTDVTDSPTKAFAAMSDDQLAAAGLSEDDVKAIRAGADPAQVVNAHRGVYTVGDREFTSDGATRRGLAGQRLAAPRGGFAARLSTAQIYLEAGDDRDEATRLLKRFGYLF